MVDALPPRALPSTSRPCVTLRRASRQRLRARLPGHLHAVEDPLDLREDERAHLQHARIALAPGVEGAPGSVQSAHEEATGPAGRGEGAGGARAAPGGGGGRPRTPPAGSGGGGRTAAPATKIARASPAVSTSGESGRTTSGTCFGRSPATASSPATQTTALSAR